MSITRINIYADAKKSGYELATRDVHGSRATYEKVELREDLIAPQVEMLIRPRGVILPKIDTKIMYRSILLVGQQYIYGPGDSGILGYLTVVCIPLFLLYYCFHFVPGAMAELVAVRNLFTRFGVPAGAGGNRTLAWLATQGRRG